MQFEYQFNSRLSTYNMIYVPLAFFQWRIYA